MTYARKVIASFSFLPHDPCEIAALLPSTVQAFAGIAPDYYACPGRNRTTDTRVFRDFRRSNRVEQNGSNWFVGQL
jgi:hypothetical protein